MRTATFQFCVKLVTRLRSRVAYLTSPRTRFHIVRTVGVVLCTWPVKSTTRAYEALWWLYMANHAALLVPMIRAFVHNLGNVVMATYSWIETMTVIESMVILVYSRLFSSQLKVLLSTAESRVLLAEEKRVIAKQYIYVYTLLYLLLTFSYLIVTFMFFGHPSAKSSQQLFLTALYPFELKSRLVKTLLYCNQAFLLVQAACIPYMDLVVAILIYMCTDRLKQLEIDFQIARDYRGLVVCVREHQSVLSLINDVNRVTRFIVIKTVVSYVLFTLASGLQILHGSVTIQWVHQTFILIFVYLRIFMCADSAENMTSASEDVNLMVYSSWYEEDRKTIYAKRRIIQRCQKVPKIYISGVMPALNKNYLSMIFYVTMSYLMTLRTVTEHA